MTVFRIATFLAPNVYPAYQAIADIIEAQLECPTELIMGDTHDQFEAINPDLAFICGLPYVLMRRESASIEAIAAPVLRGSRYGGKPIYYSDVIVHANSAYTSFSDLRGCSWAYNERVSQSGYGITRHTLLTLGETNGFFGEVIHVGWHQKAIQTIVDRTIDATAIDSQVLAIELAQNPTLAHSIKIIATLGPSTIQPVVVRSDLSNRLKSTLQSIFTALGHDVRIRPILDATEIDHFTQINDSAYDDIRAMQILAEKENFLQIG